MRLLMTFGIIILFSGFSINAQKVKFGVNFTYDIYSNLDEIDGIKSSWRTLYTYNAGLYCYDINDHYWPYDQLNMDISMQLGNNFISIEPFWSFTFIKGWYSVSYDKGKYTSDEVILYLPESTSNPYYIDGDEFLYARGSGRMAQKRLGTNIMLGNEVQIGLGIWWQKQKIDLHKSMAYNKYWYKETYAIPEQDAYVTDNDEVFVLEPTIETVYKKRLLFPLILRYSNGLFSSHITFIFQKPFQLLVGSGFYF